MLFFKASRDNHESEPAFVSEHKGPGQDILLTILDRPMTQEL
jgi:hypothetical protein